MSRNKPARIGLSARIFHPEPDAQGIRSKTLQVLEQSVAQWVTVRDVLLLMVPSVVQDGILMRSNIRLRDYAENLDGLILQGGADIDPRAYGEEPTHTVGVPDGVRDRFELDLLRGFAAAGKPVLGICRGMQLINVAYGGTLYQDLRADGATAALHVRREVYDEHVHGLRLAPDSRLAQSYGGLARGRVNSIHHQGVKALGLGLVAEAWSEDGVVESIRGAGPGFLLGVQWHPEFHDHRFPELLPADPLLRDFLAAARAARGLNALSR